MPSIKNKPDDLFILIKSMNGSEKRYFKVLYDNTAETNSSNKSFITLFDIISKQEQFEPTLLTNEIKQQGIASNINKTKQYLFNALVKALFLYHVEKDQDLRLRLDFLEIQILNKKNLSDLAKKRIKLLEKKATKHQKQLILNDVYFLLKSNLTNLGLKNFDDFDVALIKQKTSHSLETLSIENKYRDLVIDAKTVLENAKTQKLEETRRQFEKILSDNMLKETNLPKSYQAVLLFYTLKCFLLMQLGKRKDALQIINKYLQFVKTYKNKGMHNDMHYLIGLGNKIGLLMEMKLYDEIEKLLKTLKSIPCENEYYELLKFRVYYINGIQFYLTKQQKEKIINLYPEIEAGIKQYKHLLNLDVVGYFELTYARTAFEINQTDKAVRVLQKLINEFNCTKVPLLFIAVKMQLIICMYMMKNYQLIEHYRQSLLSFLRKIKLTSSFEYLFLQSLKQLPLTEVKENQLKKIIKDLYTINASNYYLYSNPVVMFKS